MLLSLGLACTLTYLDAAQVTPMSMTDASDTGPEEKKEAVSDEKGTTLLEVYRQSFVTCAQSGDTTAANELIRRPDVQDLLTRIIPSIRAQLSSQPHGPTVLAVLEAARTEHIQNLAELRAGLERAQEAFASRAQAPADARRSCECCGCWNSMINWLFNK